MLWCLWCLGLLMAQALGAEGLVRRSISLGAVLPTTRDYLGMVDARRGYRLGEVVVNKLNNRQGFRIMDSQQRAYYFQLEFTPLDDHENDTLHSELVRELVFGGGGREPVDFLLGSHPDFAMGETRLADQSEKINVQCCVGPDEIYEQGIPYVFGIPTSNRRYPELALQSMILKGLKNISIISAESNIFTSSTCGAAKDIVTGVAKVDHEGPRIVLERTYTRKDGLDGAVFKSIVEECIRNNVEAVIACSFEHDGENLVRAFHAQGKSMKAFFMTVGPTRKHWVDSLGNMSDYMLSAGQWHAELPYYDQLFGSIPSYIGEYHAEHGSDAHASYVSVGASTAVYVTVKSIQEAFRSCDLKLTFGDVDQLFYNASAISCPQGPAVMNGYERVRQAMQDLDLRTIYGRVKFNANRRNVGSDPVTSQVLNLPRRERSIYSVLPIGSANAELVMPAKNAFRPQCKEGQYIGSDDFDPCQLCRPGESSSMENADHCDRCNIGYYNPRSGQKECKACPEGTTTYDRGSSNSEECHCKVDFYSPEKLAGTACMPCPQGAKCIGGEEPPVPLPGYWMNRTYHSEAYECDPEDACTGNLEMECKEGRNGRLCAQCEEGYYNIINSCIRCPLGIAVVAIIIAVVLGWYILNVVISKNVASMDMMLNWAQLANIIGDVGLRWPGSLTTMFAVANILDFDVDILEPSCLVHWSYHHNFVVQLLLPFFMSLMAYLGYLASCLAFMCRNKPYMRDQTRLKWWLAWLVSMPHVQADLCAKWDATIAAFLSSVEVTYITVTKYCFDAFKCENVGGVLVLRSDPSVECHTSAHTKLVALGVIGILGYSVGYIVFVVWTMWTINAKRSFRDPKNLRRYGFLYRHFELDYYWTPVVCLLRRLFFVVILVFMNNPALQAGALAIIINVSLMLQVYTAPYVDTYLDVLFSFLLVTLMFEAFSGVMFYSSNLPSSDRAILEMIVLLALFALICITAVFLLLELRRKYHHHVVKSMHCKDVLRRKKAMSPSSRIMSVVSPEYKEAMKEVSNELLETFNSQFLYTALTKHPEYIEDWDKLNVMLKDFMSDKAECSYLSKDPIAKFWRKLVDRFPELIDFLAVASEESREQFRGFATTLYRNFYLTNKVERLPIYGILNWRDRAPMAQWLALASEPDRRFFTSFMSDLFKEVNIDLAESLDRKVESKGVSFSLDIERTHDSRSWWSKTLPSGDRLVLSEIISDRDPLEAKQTSFKNKVTPIQAIIRMCSADKPTRSKDDSPEPRGRSSGPNGIALALASRKSPTTSVDTSDSPPTSQTPKRSETYSNSSHPGSKGESELGDA